MAGLRRTGSPGPSRATTIVFVAAELTSLDADRERWGYRGRLCLARNHLADDVVWVMVAVTPALQRRRHFFEADRLAAILVQLAENVVGLREVGSAGANDAFKFR